MPELPEVEVVRAGLERYLVGRVVRDVEILDPRPLRRQAGGPQALVRTLTGRTLTAVVRRGKFLWLPLDDGRALSAHLGMSGQLLVRGAARRPTRPRYVRDVPAARRHLRVRLHLEPAAGDDPGGASLDLVDQRMLGGLHTVDLVPTPDGAPGGAGSPLALLPADATHIARDLLDPDLDRAGALARMRASRRAVKTLLLDQGLVSGIGNIYADEGLWEARVHGLRPGTWLGPRVADRLLDLVAAVMRRALAAGGTSFDALYVDAEGAAGYFARELAVYGRAGRPCRRCATVLRRETVGARSHTFCPRCQRRPRHPAGPAPGTSAPGAGGHGPDRPPRSV